MMFRHRIKHTSGYPGGTTLPGTTYSPLHSNFILPRHKRGVCHMAEGYPWMSGDLIVCTSQVTTSVIRSGAFREAGVTGISGGCTEWSAMVKDIAELPRRISEAFKIVTPGRFGLLLVDLPKTSIVDVLDEAPSPHGGGAVILGQHRRTLRTNTPSGWNRGRGRVNPVVLGRLHIDIQTVNCGSSLFPLRFLCM